MVRQRRSYLGYISEGVDGRSTNRLLVRLQKLEKFEANPHPLPRRDELAAPISYLADQLDAVLLYLLVPINSYYLV